MSQGIVLTKLSDQTAGASSELWSPSQLTVWSDAGFGGAGTRAQTGVLCLWAGSPVLARSSRQTTSALSTCEAEVSAASTAWVCTEGLMCLLQEWHVVLCPPILLVDNRSALTLMRLGGSWRTRYFAVRAARIMEEHCAQRVQLRYCPTKLMGADGLTKLATGEVMTVLRGMMSSKPPALPTSDMEVKVSGPQPTADAVIACRVSYGCVSMIKGRRRAEAYAFELVVQGRVSDSELVTMLRLWGFARNLSRRNVAPPGLSYVYSECFGLVYDRTGRWVLSTVGKLFPNVAKALNLWMCQRLNQLRNKGFQPPESVWKWSAVTVNRGYAAARHVDRNNLGPSVVRSFPDPGDVLLSWPGVSASNMQYLDEGDADRISIGCPTRMHAFDGTYPHQTAQIAGNVEDRFSIIFFQTARGWIAPPDVLDSVSDLGFNLAVSEDDAQQFAARFDALSLGASHTSWSVKDV